MKSMDYYVMLVRKLAKSSNYQSIYNNAKELGFKLFKNNSNLTSLQYTLVGYLNMYSTLNLDLYMGEVDEIVFENCIFEDSYIMWRNEVRRQPPDNKNQEVPKGTSKGTLNETQWVFKNRPKKG